jgi:dCTP deaminase
MILSDRDIKKALKSGRIKVTPKPDLKVQLGSCSLDLHLGNKFRVFKNSSYPYIDLKGPLDTDKIMEEVIVKGDRPFIMQPGDFALVTTVEDLQLADDLLGRIEGRSSLGRLGIIVHGTASIFDPGWRGKPTMELGNLGVMPIALYPGMRICAFTFEEVSSPVDVPYYKKKNNKYAGQQSPLASKLTQEVRKHKK